MAGKNNALPAALEQLWVRFLPEMRARIEHVEAAVAAIENNACTEDMRDAAHQAAHKLAGSLGMFGATRGSEIARALEAGFVEAGLSPDAAKLREWTAELRRIVGQ